MTQDLAYDMVLKVQGLIRSLQNIDSYCKWQGSDAASSSAPSGQRYVVLRVLPRLRCLYEQQG
jgi:hypothetical protein